MDMIQTTFVWNSPYDNLFIQLTSDVVLTDNLRNLLCGELGVVTYYQVIIQ
jgi:hypothetical protein